MKYIFLILLMACPTFAMATPPVTYVYPQTVIKQHLVEFGADTYIGEGGYHANSDKLRLELAKQLELSKQNNIDPAIVNGLLDLIKILMAKNGGNVTPTPATNNTPVVPNPNVPQPTPNGNDLDKKVYDIFKANCMPCHGESTSSNGLKLINNNGGLYNLSAVDRSNVYFRTNGGQALQTLHLNLMPMNGKPLSDGDVEILKTWAIKKIQEEKGK